MERGEPQVGALIDRLNAGWDPTSTQVVTEFVELWGKRLATLSTTLKEVSVNGACFASDLGCIRLHGTDDMRCILLGSSGPDLAATLLTYWGKLFAAGRLICVLALSDDAFGQVRDRCASSGCLILTGRQVTAMLTHAEPMQMFKRCLLEQVPHRTLIPFDVALSTSGNMFFGRHRELRRFVEDDASSFAVAGPGRIGKTSLVKAYQRFLQREGTLRARSTFYIDLYACQDRSDRGILRYIATQIAPSRHAERVSECDFVSFVKHQVHRFGQPLDLILDEADCLCQRPVLDELLRASLGQRYCRFILCGRHPLLKAMTSPNSPFCGRLSLVRLEPLTRVEAQALLVEPLTDLGLSIDPAEVQCVLALSGRLPHLVQLYGRRLAELALDEGAAAITAEHLESLRWDWSVAAFFTHALTELDTSETRLVALLILKSMPTSTFSVADILERVRSDIAVSFDRCTAICDELVIQNVLAWEHGTYRIASAATLDYARQTGYLDGALTDARMNLGASARPASERT